MGHSSKSGLVLHGIDTPLFNLSFGLYMVYKAWVFSAGPLHPWIDAYLADLLAMPVILAMLTSGMSLWLKRTIELNLIQVILAFVYTSFVMEWIAPDRFEHAIADPYDVACYAIGTVIFLLERKLLLSRYQSLTEFSS